jgi:hypothetical protein
MVDQSEKVRENRLRRMADRQGFQLVRSRRRDPLAVDYGWHVMRGKRKLAQFRDLDALEQWLTDPGSR